RLRKELVMFHSWIVPVATGSILSVLLAVASARAQQVTAKPTANRADEPLAKKFSLRRSAEFLDGATLAWAQARNCASCHTSYPYLMARPALGEVNAPALLQMRQFFEQRVAKWDEGGIGAGLPEGTEGVTEVVATAATLAFDDAQRTGKLHPATRKALE